MAVVATRPCFPMGGRGHGSWAPLGSVCTRPLAGTQGGGSDNNSNGNGNNSNLIVAVVRAIVIVRVTIIQLRVFSWWRRSLQYFCQGFVGGER